MPGGGQANAIGRSSKTVREFLEKNWKADMKRDEVIQLAVKSLLEVVQTGAKNIDLAVMDGFGKVRVRLSPCPRPTSVLARLRCTLRRFCAQNLTHDELTSVVSDIEREKEAEAERKRSRLAQSAASRDAMTSGAGLDLGGSSGGLGVGSTAEEDAGAGEV